MLKIKKRERARESQKDRRVDVLKRGNCLRVTSCFWKKLWSSLYYSQWTVGKVFFFFFYWRSCILTNFRGEILYLLFGFISWLLMKEIICISAYWKSLELKIFNFYVWLKQLHTTCSFCTYCYYTKYGMILNWQLSICNICSDEVIEVY